MGLLVDDAFWAVLEPLLPERRPRRIGRPRVSDRAAFTAIVFVLVTGVPWRMVPKEIGCSGVTAWRRLREWQAAGVWERLHRLVLDELSDAEVLDRSRGCIDSVSVRAKSACAAQLPQAVPRAAAPAHGGTRSAAAAVDRSVSTGWRLLTPRR